MLNQHHQKHYPRCLLIYICYGKYCLLDEPLALTDIFFYFYHFFNPRFLSNFNYNPYIVIRSKLKTRELSKTRKAEGLNIVILNMLITCSATLTLTFHCSSKHWYTFPESIKKCWCSQSLLTFHLHSVSSCFVLNQQDHIKTI